MSLTKAIAGQQKKPHTHKVYFWQEISKKFGYYVNMTFSWTMYIFLYFFSLPPCCDSQRRKLLNKNQN